MAIKNQEQIEFNLLDSTVIERVPNLREPGGPGQPILNAANLFHQLQDARKKILAELSGCSGPGPVGPAIQYNPADDAAALLAGTPVEELCAPVEESRRGALLRQLRAIDAALPSAQSSIAETECQIILAECERLGPLAKEFIQSTLDACENLLVCLRAQEQFFELLRKRGLRTDRRPPWMALWPQEIGWLRGDVHRPSLGRFIEDRAKAAGLAKGD